MQPWVLANLMPDQIKRTEIPSLLVYEYGSTYSSIAVVQIVCILYALRGKIDSEIDIIPQYETRSERMCARDTNG